MTLLTRRAFLRSGTAAALASGWPGPAAAQQRAVLNDASGLNPVPVVRHWIAHPEPQTTFIERLRRELKDAAAERRPFVVGAARHSMGGQSHARDATAVTLAHAPCVPDRGAGTFRAYAGTRWRTVIAALDPLGF